MSESVDPKTNKDINKGPVLRDHVYDGIEEYDQKLPNWWLFTFYIAIVGFFAYWIIYYSTDWLTSNELVFQEKLEQMNQKKADELAALMNQLDDAVLWQWSENPAIVAKGEKIYQTSCIGCHGADMTATNNIGRSLMDDHWEHGNKPMDLFGLIANGTPAEHPGFKGAKMQPWEGLIGGQAVAEVTAYILNESPGISKP